MPAIQVNDVNMDGYKCDHLCRVFSLSVQKGSRQVESAVLQLANFQIECSVGEKKNRFPGENGSKSLLH